MHFYMYHLGQVGATALIVASWKGHEEVVRVLLEEGASVNIRNKVRILLYEDMDLYRQVSRELIA